jgi:hypothetical protein
MRTDPDRIEIIARLTLMGVNSLDAAFELVDGYEQSCVGDARALVPPPRGDGSGSEDAGGLVQRLLVEQRRRAIDADMAWIAYARAELRAAKNAHDQSGERLL